VITDDEIMRLFEQADPARDDGVRMVDAAGYLDALRTRSYDMQLIDTTEAPTKTPRDNRWVLAAIVAAAIVLIVAGALIVSGGNDEEVPSGPPTSVLETAPTTLVEQAAGQSVEEAVALTRSYFAAQNDYDAELAMSYLSDDANIDGAPWVGPERYRLEIETAAASGRQGLLGDCIPVETQPPIIIRCDLEYQDLRSGELGLGPFLGNSVDVGVADGKITSLVADVPVDENGYAQQVWDPFTAWMNLRHPGEMEIIDEPGVLSDSRVRENNRLWQQRSREWVEMRLTVEPVVTGFLEAFADFDTEAAGAYLADGATTERIVGEEVQDYRQAIELYRAWGYEQQLGTCRQAGARATGVTVRCPFAYHLLGSRELGSGPFEGSYFSVTVDEQTGMITEVITIWDGDDFVLEVADPFTEWVSTTYPGDEQLMSVDGDPALTPESLALWEQHRLEYVQYVLGNAPTTTAP
jgi:hypothetical protein